MRQGRVIPTSVHSPVLLLVRAAIRGQIDPPSRSCRATVMVVYDHCFATWVAVERCGASSWSCRRCGRPKCLASTQGWCLGTYSDLFARCPPWHSLRDRKPERTPGHWPQARQPTNPRGPWQHPKPGRPTRMYSHRSQADASSDDERPGQPC